MSTAQEYVKVAQTLPPRLLRFFARYPPPPSAFNAPTLSSTAPLDVDQESQSSPEVSTTPITSSQDPNAPHIETSSTTNLSDSTATSSDLGYQNPFLPKKNPITGKWQNPVYSLRRQADIFHLARASGVEDLLPPSSKSSQVRLQKRIEQGLRVKGTGVGQRVKGKLWERTMKGRLEKRRQAMLGMPQLIERWKNTRYGRFWKQWPR